MSKQWKVTITAQPEKWPTKTYVITEGDDWDGRPVGNEFDATDLAYDLSIEDEFFVGTIDPEITEVEEEDNE